MSGVLAAPHRTVGDTLSPREITVTLYNGDPRAEWPALWLRAAHNKQSQTDRRCTNV